MGIVNKYTKKNIARITKNCPENISLVVKVSSCFLLKYVTITTFTTATVTSLTNWPVSSEIFQNENRQCFFWVFSVKKT